MLNRRIVVVDVGCRWGFTEDFLSDDDNFLIYGFDPDHEECERLSSQYSSPNIKLIPVALGAEAGDKTLYLTKDPACSSLYQPDPYLTSNYAAFHCEVEIGRNSVYVQRLDDWAKDNGVDVIDHLKIDTQGSELDILLGAGDLLNGVRSIQVEVEFNPMYFGQPVFSDVDSFLRSKGFVLWKFSEITHYSKNKTAEPPINTIDIRYDEWHSQTIGVYSGQLFWANAHYVSKTVLAEETAPIEKMRNQVLFSSIGMPDVLGDQQTWGVLVNSKIQQNCRRAKEQVTQLTAALNRAQQAEAKAQQAEAASNQALDRLGAVYASTSWRITAPLRILMNFLRSGNRS